MAGIRVAGPVNLTASTVSYGMLQGERGKRYPGLEPEAGIQTERQRPAKCRRVAPGMTKEQVRRAWGSPSDINYSDSTSA